MIRLLLVLTAFVLLGWAAILLVSGDDAATRSRKAEDAARFESLVPLAEGGDSQAQYSLGRLYQQGRGVARDAQAAARWYAKAASKGHAAARYALGKLHANGENVKQDYYRASEWYRLAADIGNHAEAQFALGELYFHGRGASHDYGEAVNWYLRAARQGHGAAQFVMGAMYQEGWGLKRDYVEAYTWYTLAMVKRRQVMAVNEKFDPTAARQVLAEKMNRHQIERAEKKAKAWRPMR